MNDLKIPLKKELEDIKDRMSRVNKQSLKIIWDLGVILNKVKEGSVYGKATILTVVKELKDYNLDEKLAYKYSQFSREYTKEELDNVLHKPKIGWGAISRLIGRKLANDKENRTLLEDKVSNGDIPLSELTNVIKEVIKPIKPVANIPSSSSSGNAPSTPSCTNGVKKMIQALSMCRYSLLSVDNNIQDLDLIADDSVKYAKALDAFFDLREILEDVVPALDLLNKKCLKIS